MEDFADTTVHIIAADKSVMALLAPLQHLHSTKLVYFGSGRDYLRYQRADRPACLLLDLELPDGSGLDVQKQLDAAGPPVIFMSSSADITAAVRAMKAGAQEFLVKPLDPSALLAAIREAFQKDWLQRRRWTLLASLHERLNRLTHREREVLPLLLAGLKNKQAAWQLGIREVTLQVHRGQIMRKMCARSFAELVRIGQVLELCPPFMQLQDSAAPSLPFSWQVCSDRLSVPCVQPSHEAPTETALVADRGGGYCGRNSGRNWQPVAGGGARR
jgi:FixJ family two-component response regulator